MGHRKIKQCILHIGMNKTGSSSIQEFLQKSDLGSQFYYVKFPSSNHSSYIKSLFLNAPEKQFNYVQRGLTAKDIETINSDLRKNLLSEIAKKEADTYLISGEGILHLDNEELKALYDFLMEFFETVLIVGYVREPWSFIESLFQQSVKGGILNRFEPRNLYPKYQLKLEKFFTVFGNDCVDLWEFNPKQLKEGDVVADFCSRLGIPYRIDKKEKAVNESLTLEAVSLLLINRLHFPFGVGRDSIQRNDRMINALMKLGTHKFEIDQSVIQPIIDANLADIKWVEEKLGAKLAIKSSNKGKAIKNIDDFIEIAQHYLQKKAGVSFTNVEDIAQYVEKLKEDQGAIQQNKIKDSDHKVYKNVLTCDNGWYFLFRGKHKQFDYLLGIETVDAKSVKNFCKNLDNRIAFCHKKSINYLHVVFPSKPVVAKEYLPSKYQGIQSLYEKYYANELGERKHFCLYPLNALEEKNDISPTFQQKGTHNTDVGYLIIVNQILETIELEPIDPSHLTYVTKSKCHDLTKMADESSEEEELTIKRPSSYVIGNREFLPGNTNDVQILYNKHAEHSKRVLVFGDSFFKGLLKILNIAFKEIVYIRSQYFHKDIVDRYNPDIMFSGTAERYLCNVASDAYANDFLFELYGAEDYQPSKEFLEAFKATMSYKYYKKQYERWRKKIDIDEAGDQHIRELYEQYLAVETGDKAISNEVKSNYEFQPLIAYVSLGEVGTCEKFTSDEVEQIRAFFTYCATWKISDDLMYQAANGGTLSLKNPLNANKIAVCNHSVQLNWGNGLRFQDDKNIFYLLQFNFTGEALFYPKRRMVIFTKSLLDIRAKLNLLINKVLKYSQDYGAYFAFKNQFGGLLVENPSPFHFYTYKLQTLFRLSKDDRLTGFSTRALSSETGLFVDLAAFQETHFITSIDQVTQNSQPVECVNNTFYLNVGEKVDYAKLTEYLELDKAFLEHAISYCHNDQKYREASTLRDDCDFMLWFSISTFKRSWLEESLALIEVVKFLRTKYKRVCVVLDGMTSKHFYQDNPKIFEDDFKVLKTIQGQLPKNVMSIDTISMTVEQKVAIASLIDFFVTSHATASLWPSRICQKTGITHISNSARKKSLNGQLHHNAYLVPENIVEDILEESRNDFHVSYKIDEKQFLDFFIKVYEKEIAAIEPSDSALLDTYAIRVNSKLEDNS